MSEPNYANGAQPPNPFRVTGWVSIKTGHVVGKCTVEMSLMRIKGVLIMRKDGELWASLPSRPLVDREGKAVMNQATGKRMYESVLEWRSKEIGDKFSAKVIAALRADSRVDLGEPAPSGQGGELAY